MSESRESGSQAFESQPLPERASLTQLDVELARQQCEIQSATQPEQIQGMVSALAEAKLVALSGGDFSTEEILNLVKRLGGLIEPEYAGDWRQVARAIRGDVGENPANIPHAMQAWAEAYAQNRLEPDELLYYFQKIHPFLDGNGRVGHCLWAIATTRVHGVWPQALPPNVFGESFRLSHRSAFGEPEDA